MKKNIAVHTLFIILFAVALIEAFLDVKSIHQSAASPRTAQNLASMELWGKPVGGIWDGSEQGETKSRYVLEHFFSPDWLADANRDFDPLRMRAAFCSISKNDRKILKDAKIIRRINLRHSWKAYETEYIRSITEGGKGGINEAANLKNWSEAIIPVYPS
jgi:hypothetical protein